MKKFKFKLAKVLEHRATLTGAARREAMLRNRILQDAEERLTTLFQSVAGNGLLSSGEMTSVQVELAGMYTQRLKREIEEQRQKIIEARKAVEVAQLAYIEAKKEEKVLITLEERQRAAYMALVAQHEQTAMDELVTQKVGRECASKKISAENQHPSNVRDHQ